MFRRIGRKDTEHFYIFDIWRTASIYFPLVFVMLIASQLAFHTGLPYEIDQINVHLGHALKTNNISEKLMFMEETLVKLAPYNGNSGWMFPTEVTDIDVTKRILNASIAEIKTELTTQDETRWAFLPHNELNAYLNEQVDKAQERISKYKRAYSSNPENNPAIYISFALLFGGIPLLGIIDYKFGGDGYDRNQRRFFLKESPETIARRERAEKYEEQRKNRPNGYGTLPKGF